MVTINDLTVLEFIVVILHTFNAVAYLVLAIKIFGMKKYLKWNSHIYPTIMVSSLIISGGLFWLLTTSYFMEIQPKTAYMMILIFSGMAGIGYSNGAEAIRIAHKYDRLEVQDMEINHLKEIIEHMKRNKAIRITLLLISLLILSSCGGLHKEISRLKTEQTTEKSAYEKRTSDLNAKIREKEQKETSTSEKIQQQKSEIEKLNTEKSQLTEKLNQQNKEDISIKGAVGTVKMTDANGNIYEIPAGQGTEINKKSESTLSREFSEMKETAERYRNAAITATKDLFTKDKTISEKEAEIKAQSDRISDVTDKNKQLAESLSKDITRKATPIWVWILTGMFLLLALQILWKSIKPKIPFFN
ncbi:MAG: hypothetical protein ACOH1X_02830 [Kaistella sp.]